MNRQQAAHLRRTVTVVPGIHCGVRTRYAICPPRCAIRVPLHKAQEPNRPTQQRSQEIRLGSQHPFCSLYLVIGQLDLKGPNFAEIRAADRVVGGVEIEGECV